MKPRTRVVWPGRVILALVALVAYYAGTRTAKTGDLKGLSLSVYSANKRLERIERTTTKIKDVMEPKDGLMPLPLEARR